MEYLSNRSIKMEYKKALEIAIQIWFIRKHSDIWIRMREVGFSPFESEKSDDPVVLGGQYAKMCYFWAINTISDAFLGQERVFWVQR